MADDLSSAVAEMRARERGESDGAQKAPSTPAPASKDAPKQPKEHQTEEIKESTKDEVPAGEETKESPPALTPDVFEKLTPEQVNELLRSNKALQQRVYRDAQSMKDKELARIQREQEEARRREEERRKLDEMDDEEFGRLTREQQREEQLVRERVIQTMAPVLYGVQTTALGQVSDAQIRQQIEQRITSGDLADLSRIVSTVIETEVGARTEKQLAKLETKLRKEIREALQKELTAAQADDDEAPPILGSGTPTGSRELHGTALIAQGVAEARRKSRQRK